VLIAKSQEGTINYLAFPAIVNGLRLLDPLMDRLKERLEKLVMHLVVSLSSLRYQSGKPVVRVLSRTPFHAMQQAPNTEKVGAGSILALLFYDVSHSHLASDSC
jgi:molybdenum cofactor sulfurtransferase